MKKRYVVGFLFWGGDQMFGDQVALIRKNRPEWQAGKLNGIGGKIEPGEKPLEAMVREFREETGEIVTDWRHFATMEGNNSEIFCFTATAMGFMDRPELQPLTDEVPFWCPVIASPTAFASPRVPNLAWLIPLAKCKSTAFTHVQFIAGDSVVDNDRKPGN